MMLLQVKNFRLWMKAQMGQRGAALVEYAVLLAFVAVIGVAFLTGTSEGEGTVSLSGSIEAIIGKVRDMLNAAAK